MIRRALLTIAVGVPVLALFAGLGYVWHGVATAPATPRTGGMYTEGMVGQVMAVNPLFPGLDQNGRDLDALLFEPLLRVSGRGTETPLLASRWDVSQDLRSYTFTIRPDARWSDGSPVTADDVVFSLRIVQDPLFPGPVLSSSWKDIVATELDPGHVRFTLPGKNASFLATLETLDIVPAHLLTGKAMADIAGASFPGQVVGSGPYMLSQQLPDRVTLQRNPYAWRRPWIDSITLRLFPSEAAALDALDRGQVDAVANLSSAGLARERKNPQVTVETSATYQYAELLFNLKPDVPYFQDQSVREAIAMAIDRRALIQGTLHGQAQPDDGPIPPSITWAYDAAATPPTYDPAGAQKLLDGDGWLRQRDGTRAKGGVTLSFDLVASNDVAPYLAIAGQVASELEQVGVDVTVQPETTASLIHDALNPRTFQMALTAFDNGPDPDVFPFWHSTQAHPGGFNFVSMKRNVFIDKDLEDGRATLDLQSRAKAYADLQELFAEQVPAVYLYSPTYSMAVSRRIHGVHLDAALEPQERYAGVADWYIEAGR